MRSPLSPPSSSLRGSGSSSRVPQPFSADLSWAGEDWEAGGTLLHASFAVPRAGTFLAHVTLDKAHVGGSPLVLRVAPGPACASRCEVIGAAHAQAVAGRHEMCAVWLRDSFGNARRHDDPPAAGELSASLALLSVHETAAEIPGRFADEYYGGARVEEGE